MPITYYPVPVPAVGGGGAIVVKEDNVTVDAAAANVDFGNGFDVTSSPAGEANVSLDLGEYTGTDLPVASGGTGASDAATARTNLGAQAQDADLDAVAALSSTGMLARTGAATFATRTITGTSPVSVANGDGVAANPTISLSPTTGSGSVVLGTSPTISTPTLTLKQSAAPAPTAEGDIQWDTDDDQIKVGDGTGTKTFSNDVVNRDRANHTGTQLSTTISDFNEAAQDAVGNILTDTATVDFTYDDAGNQISAIVVASSIGTTQLAADGVTFAKMQNITSDRLIGRDTASPGDPEELTVGGGLEFTGTGGIQRSALTGGDVTATAGSAVATISNNVVTYAKMQDIATDSLIGRDSLGSGDPETIGVSAQFAFNGSGTLDLASALTSNARVMVRSNSGADVGPRRRLNFLNGTNVTITTVDVPGSEEVTVTINATAGGGDTATTRVAKLRLFA